MSATIINGKQIATQLNNETAREVAGLARDYNFQPGLAVVLIGDNPASQVYVGMKVRKCRELGIYSEQHILPEKTSQQELLQLITKLNRESIIHGILVQFPLPAHIDQEAVVAAINPGKDVDCFHPENVGKMLIGKQDGFFPCTPYGVLVLLERSGINPRGKHAVIIGRSNIVGKPLLALLIQKTAGANATVTCVHSGTTDPTTITRQADILIAAIGRPEFVTADMVKPGAVIIDVGINRITDSVAAKGYRLVGDVQFDEVANKASMITPVPGGVGPMTIAMLMQNTLKAAKFSRDLRTL